MIARKFFLMPMLLAATACPSYAQKPKAHAAGGSNPRLRIETRESARHGTYLTDANGRTLYAFSKDKKGSGESACHHACASAWPPVTSSQRPAAANDVKPDMIGGFQRKGDGIQITYNGWPLYRFQGDAGKGQATGEGVKAFGGTWHLVTVRGQPAKKAQAQQTASASDNPFVGMDLQGPECVRYDARHDRYFVSNVNGSFTATDGNGFITRVDAGGMRKLKWIESGRNGAMLNAPKGMQFYHGRLYVADVDHVRVFDAQSGKPAGSVKIKGAQFLNDIAISTNGVLYATDTGTKSSPGGVYRVSGDGKVKAIATGPNLARPNGIDFDQDGNLVVVTFGSDKVFTMSPDGKILKTRKLKIGKLDGVIVEKDGTILVSSWKGKHIVRLKPDGSSETILTGVSKPACFELDTKHHRLLVPEVRKNRVVVAPMASSS